MHFDVELHYRVLYEVLPWLLASVIAARDREATDGPKRSTEFFVALAEWLLLYVAAVLVCRDGRWPYSLDVFDYHQLWPTVTCIVSARRFDASMHGAKRFAAAVGLLMTWDTFEYLGAVLHALMGGALPSLLGRPNEDVLRLISWGALGTAQVVVVFGLLRITWRGVDAAARRLDARRGADSVGV